MSLKNILLELFYALSKNNDNIWDLFPPVKGYASLNTKTKRSYTTTPKKTGA